MVMTAVAIMVTLVLSLIVSYDTIKDQVLEEIRSYAYLLKDISEADGNIEWGSFDELEDDVRITIVSSDGSVVYDNLVRESSMENHGKRNEIEQAMETGEGFSVRRSSTLSENLFYYAVKVNDGNVIRVSKQASNPLGMLFRLTPVLIAMILVLFLICVVLANMVTNRLMAPIENLSKHMDDMESVEVYEELKPFVETIRKQHDDIMKSATIRQDFTANVTHELKTPLTSISGYAELIENRLVDEENTLKFAAAIHKNATRLLTLINDIIRLSELDALQTEPEFEELDLLFMAKSCAQLLEISAQKNQVKITVEGYSQHIRGNRQMIDELIYNLCDNAIRYNKPGGMAKISVYRDKRGAVLNVKDDGIGIPKEHQTRIFERFYRVDKSRSKERGGTGLGLAIVKHIAQVHNAVLEVTSEPNQGTSIDVVFK